MSDSKEAQSELFAELASPKERKRRDSSGAARFKEYGADRYQRGLFATNIFDHLPAEHDCYLFDDLISQLDTQEAEKHFSAIGQRAYAPKQLIAILIYAYSRGVFSSRQIEQRCREDLGFMYIAGSNVPNFRVLSDFRKEHQEQLHSCFVQTVKLALELKLVNLAHISLDGSKFKANSSKHKAMSYAGLKAREQALGEEIESLVAQASRADEEENQQYLERTGYELPEDLKFKQQRLEKIQAAKQALEEREKRRSPDKEIDGKKQISFADHDANLMGKKGHVDYAYNAQISADSKSQIVVGQHLSDRANDYGEVATALDELESTCGELPQKISMDNGYYSGANLAELEKRDVEAYVATSREDKRGLESLEDSTRAVVKADFQYNEQNDNFKCPTGQILTFEGARQSGDTIRYRYQAPDAACAQCPLKTRCCHSQKGKGRTITTDQHEVERRRMVELMEKDESREIYDKRKVIVEPVFGQIKNTGFRGFSVRGAVRVAGEFSLVTLTHNLKKMVGAARAGLIYQDNRKWFTTQV